jgi:hypothetical protein
MTVEKVAGTDCVIMFRGEPLRELRPPGELGEAAQPSDKMVSRATIGHCAFTSANATPL